VTSVLFVITDVMFGRAPALGVAIAAAVMLAVLWFAMPLVARARDGHR
jgi:hypothetical protein